MPPVPDPLVERKPAYNPELLEQLYKGEKARNQLLVKQVNDLKLELNAFGAEIKQAAVIRQECQEYQQLILRYEQQSRLKDEEYQQMHKQVRQRVQEQENINKDLAF